MTLLVSPDVPPMFEPFYLSQGTTVRSQRRRKHPDANEHYQRMRDIVTALNGLRPRVTYPGRPSFLKRLPLGEMQVELRTLVDRWMKSGPNLRKMFTSDPILKERARYGRTELFAGPDGQGYLEWSPDIPGSTTSTGLSSPQDEALTYFIDLVTNPEWALLGGPCKECTDYFLKMTKRDRVFCSKACSSASTAFPYMKRKRQEKKDAKVKRAKQLISEWRREKPRGFTWQKWITRDTDFSDKWLTQAVNKGLIRGPKVHPSTVKNR